MVERGMSVIKLGEIVMILDLHRQGLSVSAIARQTNVDRKTIRKYIERGLEAPAYGPRKPRATVIDPFTAYLRERVAAYPGLSGRRLLRELKERGYVGGYTAVTDFLRDVRPTSEQGFEVRFETAPGEQAQVDFAQFQVIFTDEPLTPRIVWLFSMVLGHSRLIWARFAMHQDLPTVLRCHVAAFDAIGGVPREILYDRMKTAVIGEGETGGIVYNRALLDLARHYGFHPPAKPIAPRRRERSSDHSAISAKTSSWHARFVTSTTLTANCGIGLIRSPIRVCTRQRCVSSWRPMPRSVIICAPCRWLRSEPC